MANNLTPISFLSYHRATGWQEKEISDTNKKSILGYSYDNENPMTDLWIKYRSSDLWENSSEYITLSFSNIPLILTKFLDEPEDFEMFIGCYTELPQTIASLQQPKVFYDYHANKYIRNEKTEFMNSSYQAFTLIPQNSTEYFIKDFQHSFTLNINDKVDSDGEFYIYINIQIVNNKNNIYLSFKNDLSVTMNQSSKKRYTITLNIPISTEETLKLVGEKGIAHGAGYKLITTNSQGEDTNLDKTSNKIPVFIHILNKTSENKYNYTSHIQIPYAYQNEINKLNIIKEDIINDSVEVQISNTEISPWELKNTTVEYQYGNIQNNDLNELAPKDSVNYVATQDTFLSAVPKEIHGYQFSGWYVQNASAEGSKFIPLNEGLNSDKSFSFQQIEDFQYGKYIATYEPIEYPIVYIYGEGQIREGTNLKSSYNIRDGLPQVSINNFFRPGYTGVLTYSIDLNNTLIYVVNWKLDTTDTSNNIKVVYGSGEKQVVYYYTPDEDILFPPIDPYNNYRLMSVEYNGNYYSCHRAYKRNEIDGIVNNTINITKFYTIRGTLIEGSKTSANDIQYWPLWVKNNKDKYIPGYSMRIKDKGGNWI